MVCIGKYKNIYVRQGGNYSYIWNKLKIRLLLPFIIFSTIICKHCNYWDDLTCNINVIVDICLYCLLNRSIPVQHRKALEHQPHPLSCPDYSLSIAPTTDLLRHCILHEYVLPVYKYVFLRYMWIRVIYFDQAMPLDSNNKHGEGLSWLYVPQSHVFDIFAASVWYFPGILGRTL